MYLPFLEIAQPNPIDDALRQLIESIRRAMPCGIPSLGIPPLEPLHVPQFYVDINLNEAALRGWLQNLVASQTSTFTLQDASFSILGLRLNIRLYWQNMHISTLLNGIYARLNNDCFMNGNGDANFNAGGISFYGEFYLGFSGLTLQLTRIHSDVSVQSIQGNTNGWEGSVDHQNKCRRDFEIYAPGIVRNNQQVVNKLLSDIIMPIANEQLRQMTLNDLLNLINGGGNGIPSC